jgi:hypothetical protein
MVLEENPAIVKVANTWIIMNPGGGPTPDKPDVILRPPEPGDPVSAFLNVRVADIAAFYADAKAKGAMFLTEPLARKAELRCYLRDPDDYLIEVGSGDRASPNQLTRAMPAGRCGPARRRARPSWPRRDAVSAGRSRQGTGAGPAPRSSGRPSA